MRVAIEMLTLWMEPGEEARRHAVEHIWEILDAPTDEQFRKNVAGVVAGALNLTHLLLLRLAQKEGAESDEEIALMAGEILRSMSPQLPE